MNGRIRYSLAALFAVVLLTAAAAAQPLTWSPPCGTLRVKDATGFAVSVNVVLNPGGVVTLNAPPLGPSPTIATPPVTNVNGIISAGGFFYPVVQPGPPSPPNPFGNGWIPNVTIAPGICVDLYLDLVNCTIYVYPTTAPPPCRP